MSKQALLWPILAALLAVPSSALVASAPRASVQDELLGTWEGSLVAGGRSIRTVLHLALDDDGRLAGAVDSPEQNAFGLGVSELAFDEGALSFRVPSTRGEWQGRLDPDTGALAGTWRQNGAELELVLTRTEVDPLVGTWEGVCDFGSVKLRLVFHVGTREDGSLGASMVSPDQSASALPVGSVEVGDDGSIRFDITIARASYTCTLSDDATELVGHFSQNGAAYELTLERVRARKPVRRPQTPKPPFSYRSEEVSYENEQGGNRLGGTLTLPEGDGPFPAVLLITGSGAQDRDEQLFEHRPFLVIADHLSRRGVAVLRVDDRGVGASTGDFAEATTADFATDAGAGIDYLKTRAEVQGSAIGLMGHSEGGVIAPLVASGRDDVAFLVLLAGTGIPGDELLYLQAALIARAGGSPPAAIEANRELQRELFEILKSDVEMDEVVRRARTVLEARGVPAESQLAQVATPWFRYFVNHDPRPALRRVRCPVLAVNGEKDLQVPPAENLGAIAAALAEGGNEAVVTKEFPGLNHLFQHCASGSPSEYPEIEETFSVEVLDFVVDWLGEQVGAEIAGRE